MQRSVLGWSRMCKVLVVYLLSDDAASNLCLINGIVNMARRIPEDVAVHPPGLILLT